MGLNFAGIKFRGFRGFWSNPRNLIPRKIWKLAIREINTPQNLIPIRENIQFQKITWKNLPKTNIFTDTGQELTAHLRLFYDPLHTFFYNNKEYLVEPQIFLISACYFSNFPTLLPSNTALDCISIWIPSSRAVKIVLWWISLELTKNTEPNLSLNIFMNCILIKRKACRRGDQGSKEQKSHLKFIRYFRVRDHSPVTYNGGGGR